MLCDIDTLVFDLPIVGCRVYTFKATLKGLMSQAKASGIRMVVLDRPNPMGRDLEGPIAMPSHYSFVAPSSLPMRHGLSMGEVAMYLNRDIGCQLEVLEMKHWQPHKLLSAPARQWVATSPNLPTLETIFSYPGTVIFEGCNVSEGRGTCSPFRLIGAGFIEKPNHFKQAIAKLLEGDDCGFELRPVFFQPTFQKWAGRVCGGVQIHRQDTHCVRPFKLAIAMMQAAIEIGGKAFQWTKPPYEYEYERDPIDMIFAHPDMKKIFQQEMPSSAFWSKGLAAYKGSLEGCYLYGS
jgi:uncharacterized protein YbbC (DUF1343 family)